MSKIKKPYFNLYKSGREGSYFSKNLKKIIKTHLPKSICSKCGATECHKFWKKFTPVSWFRGDDDMIDTDYPADIEADSAKNELRAEMRQKLSILEGTITEQQIQKEINKRGGIDPRGMRRGRETK